MQTVVFVVLLSYFYYGSSANLIKRFEGDTCEEQILPKPPCCGIGKESAARIVDGTDVGVNEFPWMVNLGSCGGSLINSRWVLTAAQCVDVAGRSNVIYFAAQNCSNKNCTKFEKAIEIKKRFTLKGNLNLYLKYSYDDIALVQLKEPVTFSDAIRPICLPPAVDQHLGGRKAVISGWGAFDQTGKDLLKTTIEIWTPERCEEFDRYGYNLSSKYVICAGGNYNAICGGDAGGPLFLKLNNKKNIEPYYQVGIGLLNPTSCGQKDYPQRFTNVNNYMKWIIDTMLENQDD